MLNWLKSLNLTTIIEKVIKGATSGAAVAVYVAAKSGQPLSKDLLVAAAISGAYHGAYNVMEQNKAQTIANVKLPNIPAEPTLPRMPIPG